MNALKEKILRLIAAEGPITLAQYMEMALGDPEHGYYRKRDPLGARGDFITAPEISQIFGELIGLWFVQAWEERGRPSRFHFVELGPGRATLMADMLRAAKIRPEFLKAAQVTLVETSPMLREVQKQALQSFPVEWVSEFASIPDDAHLFLVANEFLDALPIHQFVKTQTGWHERMVMAAGGKLAFIIDDHASDTLVSEHLRNAPIDSIFEFSTVARKVIGDVATHIAQTDGAALFIDYGHEQSGLGDTFQAVKAHKFADPLAEPGEADLTAHVDFEALSAVAREANTYVFGPEPQGAFLEELGILVRAETLKHKADNVTRAAIDAGVNRLVSPAQMGTLFKVMTISDGHFRGLPGFSCSSL